MEKALGESTYALPLYASDNIMQYLRMRKYVINDTTAKSNLFCLTGYIH